MWNTTYDEDKIKHDFSRNIHKRLGKFQELVAINPSQ